MTAALASALTVLLHGTLVDGTDAPPKPDVAIEIRDGVVTAVVSAEGYEPPESAEVRDATGKWIVPGLIDTHTHLFDSGSLYTSPDDYDLTDRVPHAVERERIRRDLPETLGRFLCAGVTTVASLGGPRWELEVARERKAPHVLTAGPFLASFPVGELTLWTRDDPVLVQLTSAADARAQVRTLAGRGVDLIKVGYAGTSEGIDGVEPVVVALVEAAHRAGLRVAMHAEALEVAKMALRAGVDILAHTIVDRRVDEAFLTRARSRGVFVISGLAHFDRYREVLSGAVALSPIERRCGDPRVIASWRDLAGIPPASRPPVPESIRWGSSDEARAILLANVGAMHEAGIPVVPGSNGGNVGTLQGPSFHRELERLARAGLTPEEVLVAATRDAARALGLEDRGTLARGKLADLVVLAADPLEKVENLAAIDFVMVEGDVVYRRRP